MQRLFSIIAAGCVLALSAGSASAHNVWCHCPQQQGVQTLRTFEQAEKVTALQRKMIDAWYKASVTIEYGVIAEFKSKLQGTKVEAKHFRATLAGLIKVRKIARQYQAELKRFKKQAVSNPEPNFETALTKIFAEARITRVATKGVRHADIASKGKTPLGLRTPNGQPASGCGGLVDVLDADLQTLMTLLDETIDATRDAIPLAERGEFAKVMLSGRNKFGAKMPQLTDAFSRYERMFVQLVLSTIEATMQVYPKGFEFLE